MSVLLETSLGDLVLDLDVEGSPLLVRNFIRLVQARVYTQTLLYQVVPGRIVYGGDPLGDGTGGACADALLRQWQDESGQRKASSKETTPPSITTNAPDTTTNTTPVEERQREQALIRAPYRFLTSQGQRRLTANECREKGRLVAVELGGVRDTVGSQFCITIGEGPGQALDGYSVGSTNTDTIGWLSLGKLVEDDHHVLDQLNRTYVDNATGRPMADIRIRRALIVYNPFSSSEELWPKAFLQARGIEMSEPEDNDNDGGAGDDKEPTCMRSPSPLRPAAEMVAPRIPIEQVMAELDQDEAIDEAELARRAREEAETDRRHQDASRARVLEMLGDLPAAEAKAPKNVLFVAKLNPITTDEDLQLIFSRFDPNVKVDIIRDHDTGQSLQYAFCAFTTEQQAVEAYFKMNQALIDDRRVLVDFSQSVSHVWDKYRQTYRNMPKAHTIVSGGGAGRAGGGSSRQHSHHRGPPHDRSQPRGDGPDRHHGNGRGGGRSHEGRPRHYHKNGEERMQRPHSRHLEGSQGRRGDYRRDSRTQYNEEHNIRVKEEKHVDRGDGSRSRGSTRYASDDEHYEDKHTKRKVERYDSEDDSEGREHRKRRYDSSDEDRKEHKREKRRCDSEEEKGRKRRRKEKKRSHRYDSGDSDDSRRKKKKHHKRHRSDRDNEGRHRNRERHSSSKRGHKSSRNGEDSLSSRRVDGHSYSDDRHHRVRDREDDEKHSSDCPETNGHEYDHHSDRGKRIKRNDSVDFDRHRDDRRHRETKGESGGPK